MSDNKKRNIITIIFGLLMLFTWYLSGYDFNTRGKSIAEEFYLICSSIVVLYVTLPFLIQINNNRKS